jgi:hypothetical protein
MTIDASNSQAGTDPRCNSFDLLAGVTLFGGHLFGGYNPMA